jgi:hypothetical protein
MPSEPGLASLSIVPGSPSRSHLPAFFSRGRDRGMCPARSLGGQAGSVKEGSRMHHASRSRVTANQLSPPASASRELPSQGEHRLEASRQGRLWPAVD